MDLSAFKKSVAENAMPAGMSASLRALWVEARGDWDQAHQVAQDISDATGAWVHAYLHRKEGDESNARYWYSQAGQSPFRGSHDAEWDQIVTALLAR
ncbi:MAG TPA: hypothetical protein VGJ84_05060 [Polyangiaceae bacterium]|jgi:hypothetical protein